MNCPNCGSEVVKMDLREQKVGALLVEIEELKNVNEVIKEYNMLYLKEIATLRQQAQRVHEQADLLRGYREENEDLKRRLTAQKSILSGLKKKNDHFQRALTYFAESGSERAKDVLDDFTN